MKMSGSVVYAWASRRISSRKKRMAYLEDETIALTNNKVERALYEHVLWRKGNYGAWSHPGDKFSLRILSKVEMIK